MTNSTDQERQAIHLAFERKLRAVNLPHHGERKGDWRTLSREETADVVLELLEARAQQPASVAVPGEWREMTEELKPAAVHDANVFLPGCLGPVRRDVVLLSDHEAYVDALRAQLPSQGGEAVAWRVTGAGGLTVAAEYPRWAEDDSRLLIESLYTHADPLPGLRLALDLLTEDGQGFMQKRVIVDKLIELGVTLPPDQLM